MTRGSGEKQTAELDHSTRWHPSRLDSLTGLRFVAALVVFLLHAEMLFNPAGRRAVGAFFDAGGVGVSFFFMLSGFVLAWSRRESDTAGRFYRRRAARVLPLYYLSSLVCLAVMQLENGLGSQVGLGGWLVSLTGLQAWLPSMSQGGNSVLWSLSAELFFYLMFPVLYRAVARLTATGLRVLAVALLALSIIVPIIVPVGSFWLWLVYICPAFRLSEFVLGIVLALLVRQGVRFPLVPAALLAVVAWVAASHVPQQVQNVSVTLVPLALLIVAAASSDLDGRSAWIRSRPALLLGEWSFAFYVFHKLVIRTAAALFGVDHGTSTAVLLTVSSLAVSVAISAAAFHWIERPLERRLRGYGTLPVTVAPLPTTT